MTSCKYNIAPKKLCGQEAAPDSKYCLHHSTLQCVSCHEQATHNCTAEGKEKLCGCPICGTCEHRDLPNGMNGQFYQHAKPGEELVIPHYAKEVFK